MRGVCRLARLSSASSLISVRLQEAIMRVTTAIEPKPVVRPIMPSRARTLSPPACSPLRSRTPSLNPGTSTSDHLQPRRDALQRRSPTSIRRRHRSSHCEGARRRACPPEQRLSQHLGQRRQEHHPQRVRPARGRLRLDRRSPHRGRCNRDSCHSTCVVRSSAPYGDGRIPFLKLCQEPRICRVDDELRFVAHRLTW